MKKYTEQLSKEMEEIEGKTLKTERGFDITFQFDLIPSDQKWVASMSGELNNAATYFSSFANVNKTSKEIMDGSIGTHSKATWKPWDYSERIKTAKKVAEFKKTLRDPGGKERSKVTAFIAKQKSRQEYNPPLGKFVDVIKAEPLHNTNNAWQHWFTFLLAIAMQYTSPQLLKSVTALSELPSSSTIVRFMNCIKDAVKCDRLYKSFCRWFREKRKTNVDFSYRFTGLESKRFCWNFSFAVKELLNIESISKTIQIKVHVLAYVAVELRDATSIFTRVHVNRDHITQLSLKCRNYFNAYKLFLGSSISPTIWTVGYAIPYHCLQVFNQLKYGLGLNSMQGREAKHIKLAKYVENTCNVRKSDRWWIVFRHEFISMIWLRELDPFSISYKNKKAESYTPTRINSTQYCYCGNLKNSPNAEKCSICSNQLRDIISKSVDKGKADSSLII
jgi:hypothetical protein